MTDDLVSVPVALAFAALVVLAGAAMTLDFRTRSRAALSRAKAEHADRLLRYIKQVHRRGGERDEDGFALCAECEKPHPCETYRSASGDPGWPRPADEVLAEPGGDRHG